MPEGGGAKIGARGGPKFWFNGEPVRREFGFDMPKIEVPRSWRHRVIR